MFNHILNLCNPSTRVLVQLTYEKFEKSQYRGKGMCACNDHITHLQPCLSISH